MSKPPTSPRPTAAKVGMWHAIRDIFVAAINKGQLLPMLLGSIILLVIFKMDSNQIGGICREVIDNLVNLKILGWILFVVVSVVWAIVGKIRRNSVRREMERIGAEKSKAQRRAQGKDIKSSNRPK